MNAVKKSGTDKRQNVARCLHNPCNPPALKPEDYISNALSFFRDVGAQRPAGWTPDGAPDTWPEKYPANCRLMIDANAENLAAAQRLGDKLPTVREGLFGAVVIETDTPGKKQQQNKGGDTDE